MLEELKEAVLEANLALHRYGLVKATSGNVSARDRASGLIAIKPSGYEYSKLTRETIVVVDPEGKVVEGGLTPSADTASHLYVYGHMDEIHGIAHTHSPYATSFALRGETIPICLTALAMEFGREIPVSDFAVIGGEEIGKAIVERYNGCPAILMRNHGVFTIGENPQAALKAAVMLEEAAQTVHYAMLRGAVRTLPERVIEESYLFYQKVYGQKQPPADIQKKN